jgi:hypothetical protein
MKKENHGRKRLWRLLTKTVMGTLITETTNKCPQGRN